MFTKKDLKNGMVVETRDGCRYIVVGDRLLGQDGFLRLSDYETDLCDHDDLFKTKEGNSPYDIMLVFDVVGDLQIDNVGSSPLFDRRSDKESSKNNDEAKYFCKEFANIYNLDKSKLYSRFLKILYDISGRKVPVTEFDIEKCSETDIKEAVRAIGKECATYCIIKTTEKD